MLEDDKKELLEEIKSLRRRVKLRDTKIQKLKRENARLKSEHKEIREIVAAAYDLYIVAKCSNLFDYD